MKRFLRRIWCYIFHEDDVILDYENWCSGIKYTWQCQTCGEQYTYHVRDYR